MPNIKSIESSESKQLAPNTSPVTPEIIRRAANQIKIVTKKALANAIAEGTGSRIITGKRRRLAQRNLLGKKG